MHRFSLFKCALVATVLGPGFACVPGRGKTTTTSKGASTSPAEQSAVAPSQQQAECIRQLKTDGATVITENPTLNADSDWQQQLERMVAGTPDTKIREFLNYTNADVHLKNDSNSGQKTPDAGSYVSNLGLNRQTTPPQNWVFHYLIGEVNRTQPLGPAALNTEFMLSKKSAEEYHHFPKSKLIESVEQLSLFEEYLQELDVEETITLFEAAKWYLGSRPGPIYFWDSRQNKRLDTAYVQGLRFWHAKPGELGARVAVILARDEPQLQFPKRLMRSVKFIDEHVPCRN